jgi:hypothetical protein
MSREWKLGDVAMVRGDVCLRLHNGLWEHGRGDRFAYNEPTARPLVVIDPEDREQVERLASAIRRAPGPFQVALQDALRAFADPEPCGASLTLGKDGALYRCAEAEGHDGPHADGTCIWTAVQS